MSFAGPITAHITVNDDESFTVTGSSEVWNCFVQECVDKYDLGNDAHVVSINRHGVSSYCVGNKVAVCSTAPITPNRIDPNVKFNVETALGLTGVTVTLTPELDPEQSYDIALVPERIYDLWASISGK